MSRARAVLQASTQWAFQRDQHHGWRRIAAVLAAANLLATAALAGYVHLHSTVYVAVAATPDGRLIRLTPLDEPVMSDAALKNWVVSAVTEAFTLGHHDWRMRLSAAREHFTDDGYESFLKGLEDSLILDRLRENLQVASAVAQGAPVITEARRIGGRLAWRVEFPFLLTFAVGARRLDRGMIARVLVTRVPLSERARGIGIAQIVATLGKPRAS